MLCFREVNGLHAMLPSLSSSSTTSLAACAFCHIYSCCCCSSCRNVRIQLSISPIASADVLSPHERPGSKERRNAAVASQDGPTKCSKLTRPRRARAAAKHVRSLFPLFCTIVLPSLHPEKRRRCKIQIRKASSSSLPTRRSFQP